MTISRSMHVAATCIISLVFMVEWYSNVCLGIWGWKAIMSATYWQDFNLPEREIKVANAKKQDIIEQNTRQNLTF